MAHLFQSLLKRRARALGSRPRIVRRFGRDWLIDPSDQLDLRLWAGRDIEPKARDALVRLGRRSRATMFFDIGANAGCYAMTLADALPDLTQVHAFEPAGATYARLVANLWLNDLVYRVETHRLALGARNEQATLFTPAGVSGGASLARETAQKATKALVEQVRVRRFDDLFELENKNLLFKIDVEATEDAVIEGMRRTLSANRCALQIEVFPNRADRITTLLSGLGLEPIGAIGRDRYFTNMPQFTVGWTPQAVPEPDASDARAATRPVAQA